MERKMKNFIIAIALTLITIMTGCATTGIQVQQEVGTPEYSHKCENPRYMHTISCRAHKMRLRMAQMKRDGRCKETIQRVVQGNRTVTRTLTKCE